MSEFALNYWVVANEGKSHDYQMEDPASHPLSAAIVAAAANEQVPVPRHLQLKDHTMVAGEGITARVDGQLVHVDNKTMFQRLRLCSGARLTYFVALSYHGGNGVTIRVRY